MINTFKISDEYYMTYSLREWMYDYFMLVNI
jgi:hypothetical protein